MCAPAGLARLHIGASSRFCPAPSVQDLLRSADSKQDTVPVVPTARREPTVLYHVRRLPHISVPGCLHQGINSSCRCVLSSNATPADSLHTGTVALLTMLCVPHALQLARSNSSSKQQPKSAQR